MSVTTPGLAVLARASRSSSSGYTVAALPSRPTASGRPFQKGWGVLPRADDVVDGADDERPVRAGREDADGAARLQDQGVAGFEPQQLAPDGRQRLVVPGGLREARVHDELVGPLGDV